MYHQLFGTMSIPWSCYLMTKAAGQSALQGPKLTKDPVFVFCSLRGLAAGGGVLASRRSGIEEQDLLVTAQEVWNVYQNGSLDTRAWDQEARKTSPVLHGCDHRTLAWMSAMSGQQCRTGKCKGHRGSGTPPGLSKQVSHSLDRRLKWLHWCSYVRNIYSVSIFTLQKLVVSWAVF